jgi:hypothetical protein
MKTLTLFLIIGQLLQAPSFFSVENSILPIGSNSEIFYYSEYKIDSPVSSANFQQLHLTNQYKVFLKFSGGLEIPLSPDFEESRQKEWFALGFPDIFEVCEAHYNFKRQVFRYQLDRLSFQSRLRFEVLLC